MKLSRSESILGGLFLVFLVSIFAVAFLSPKTKNIANPSLQSATPYFVNINTADASELDSLDGIGAKLADKIIEYREEHGDFKSADDLTSVPGIGSFVVSKIKDSIIFE